jgi:hypothetical protein
MAKATREQRYAKGYLPKIQYWAEKLYNACEDNDTIAISTAKANLDYFYTRQQRALLIDEVINNTTETRSLSDMLEAINGEFNEFVSKIKI